MPDPAPAPPVSAVAGPLVAPLAAFGRHDLARAGGKGANLGELLRAGFPVPPGFVVTTAAYERFAAQDTARRALDAAFSQAGGAPTDVPGTRALEEAWLAAPVPDDVAAAVLAAYRSLGGAVAVRSSATAEDLPGATFAGQQETVLNVVGEAALLDALRRCWTSLWTERAVAYRRQQGVDHRSAKMAVVVQRMVPAEVAGVLFTADPITGRRDALVLDASPGLGEAVVSGLVTPDHFVVDKRTLNIRERRLGRREVVVRALPGGGTTRSDALSGQTVEQPSLPDGAVRALARLGLQVERHFGAPQDVEWTWAGGEFALVQSRPITALPPQPPALARPARRARRSRQRVDRGLAAELFPVRPYPLDLTSYTVVQLQAVGEAMASPIGLDFVPLDRAVVQEDGVAVRLAGFGPRPTLRLLYQPWLTLWQRRHLDFTRWEQDPILPEARRRARDLESRDVAALSWPDLLRTLHDALDLGPYVAGLRYRYFPPAVFYTLLLWLLLRLLGRGEQMNLLVSGVDTKTLELNRALEALADEVRAGDTLRRVFAETEPPDLPDALAALPAAQPFLRSFGAFLERYGHRESLITLASLPAWRTAPEIPLGIVKALAAAPPAAADGAADGAAPQPPSWVRARDDLLAHTVLGRWPLRPLFRRVLARARCFPQLREDTHFYMTLGLPAIQRCVHEAGRRLADAGVLATPDDVWHLTLPEIERIAQAWPPAPAEATRLRHVVAARQAKRASLAGQPFVEPVPLPPEATEAEEPDDAGGALVRGLAGSAGGAEGPVRVIHGPAEFGRLQPGDVLVAPFTTPAWTPLFRRAAAVVVDAGSPISHAAIVAREYGLPAVMGAAGATQRLADGQRVRVDGARGLVFAAG